MSEEKAPVLQQASVSEEKEEEEEEEEAPVLQQRGNSRTIGLFFEAGGGHLAPSRLGEVLLSNTEDKHT